MPATNLPMPPRLSLTALAVRQQFQPRRPPPPADPTISLEELQAAVRRLSLNGPRRAGKTWAAATLRQHLEQTWPKPLEVTHVWVDDLDRTLPLLDPKDPGRQLPLPMPGQWWERLGQVVYLHPQMNPNDDPMFQGWKSVSQQEARRLLP